MIAALLVAILVVALVAPSAASASPTHDVLTGQVTGPGSVPLSYVKVQVLSGSTVVAQTMTGWNGKYHVSVPAGTYDVKFSRHGYETLTDSAVVVSAPSTTLDATLTALPKLVGQVTGPGSVPLSYVKVQVLSGSTVVAQTLTGWNGKYHVSVPAGTYDVKFSRHGYETLTDSAVVVSAPSTTLDATLTPSP